METEESYVVSIPEAARTLGISRYTLERAIDNGNVETRNFEGRLYVLRTSLNEYMEHGSKNR